jgi:transcription elongation factor GreA
MTTKTFLTQEGYNKLTEELDYLRKERRLEVADRLHKAIEEGGDRLGEDPEYEAAKNEQAFVEGRIRDLEVLLAKARIIEKNGSHDSVQVGSHVTIREEGFDPEKYQIVGAAEANPRDGLISNESPLGRALLENKVGDKVTVKAPSGQFVVEIVKIE